MANSNRHFNLPLRQKYRDENIGCDELGLELGIDFTHGRTPSFFPRGVLRIPAHDCHHIFGGNPRWDLWSNLICIHRLPHTLLHDGCHGEPRYIRLLSLAAKIAKAERIGDPKEFSVDELNVARGSSVEAWVEYFAVDPEWSWVAPYHEELLERMQRWRSASSR
jgi:hypothetical protein